MTIPTLASIVAIALTGLAPGGCHSTQAAAKKPAAASTPAATTQPAAGPKAAEAAPKKLLASQIILDGTNCFLGDVNLTNHTETWVTISPTKQCMFTTRKIDSRNAQITLSLETKNAKNKVADLAVTQIVTKGEKPFEVAFGDCSLSFTPHISE
jgi:hypothetical protein